MTDREWLLAHGDFTDDQVEQFAKKVGNILDSAEQQNPRVEWQARMLALSEMKRRKA
jgi:Asp-tRNA(Asn)/Glu-tRNA(Gln) amidotransferase C subunit